MIVRPLKKIYEPYLQYSTTHTVALQNRNNFVMISFYQFFVMIWILKSANQIRSVGLPDLSYGTVHSLCLFSRF